MRGGPPPLRLKDRVRTAVSPKRRPDFIGIGSPQSGTTWLAANLDRHPQVGMSEPKEIEYYSRHLDRGPGWYKAHFGRVGKPIAGEITPSYGRIPKDRIALVRRDAPDARLILIMRNPVERAWSAARRTMGMMAKAHFRCDVGDIPLSEYEAYLVEDENYHGNRLLGREGVYEAGLRAGHYSRILDNWLSVFPENQLLALFFDDVAAEPRRLLERVFGHIGATTDLDFGVFETNKINTNPDLEMPDPIRSLLTGIYGPEIETLRRRFGRAMPDWGTAQARAGANSTVPPTC